MTGGAGMAFHSTCKSSNRIGFPECGMPQSEQRPRAGKAGASRVIAQSGGSGVASGQAFASTLHLPCDSPARTRSHAQVPGCHGIGGMPQHRVGLSQFELPLAREQEQLEALRTADADAELGEAAPGVVRPDARRAGRRRADPRAERAPKVPSGSPGSSSARFPSNSRTAKSPLRITRCSGNFPNSVFSKSWA